MVDDDEVVGLLRRMRQEAAETEGKKSAIQEKAKETKSEVVEACRSGGPERDGMTVARQQA